MTEDRKRRPGRVPTAASANPWSTGGTGSILRNKANSQAERRATGPAKLFVPPAGPIVLNKANLPTPGDAGEGQRDRKGCRC